MSPFLSWPVVQKAKSHMDRNCTGNRRPQDCGGQPLSTGSTLHDTLTPRLPYDPPHDLYAGARTPPLRCGSCAEATASSRWTAAPQTVTASDMHSRNPFRALCLSVRAQVCRLQSLRPHTSKRPGAATVEHGPQRLYSTVGLHEAR